MKKSPYHDGPRKPRPSRPLNPLQLSELALSYVSRFATTRAKLMRYLDRKLFERGWAGDSSPDVEGIVERLVSLNYVDDAAFAETKARRLARRGYGNRRVEQSLRADGVTETDRANAIDQSGPSKIEAALRYAERRRWGPYASESQHDPAARQKMLAAFIRAGHDFEVARMIITLAPGANVRDLMDD